jgi:hypothetical protein
LRRNAPQANNHLRPDRINLPHEIGRARRDFIFFGSAILGRPAFHNIADVNVFALQTHRLDHLVQQFPSASNERQTLRVFIRARPFSDKHELRRRIPGAEDDLVPALVQPASSAFAEIFANSLESIAFDFVSGIEE